MNELRERSNELLQEEIRKVKERLNKFVFPCPHCHGKINDEHFGADKRAFAHIKELGGRIVEEEIISRWANYKGTILEEVKNRKIYEEFPAVRELKEAIKKNEEKFKHYERKISELNSAEHIENLTIVKRLQGEKKELDDKYTKKVEVLQLQNQDLQKQIIAKQEQIQNILFHQKDRRKGLDFEQWFLEELRKVFDDRDNIIDVSKGQASIGKRGDFLQEIFTENEPRKLVGRIIYETKNTEKWSNEWIAKLEKDMETHRADYGFIVATCESDKPIRPLDSRKKIYISGDNSNIFIVAKIMRELLITKCNFEDMIKSDEKEQKIKNLKEWVEYKLPRYVSILEDELNSQEKEADVIIREAGKIKKSKEKIWELTIDKMILEIKSI